MQQPPEQQALVSTQQSTPEGRAEFIKVEKNLNSLGFFTPARHRGPVPKKKTVTIRREVNGKVIEAQATILPSAEYGLPTTADLDKYLAFQKIVDTLRNEDGQVSNPIGFTTAQLVNVLGINTTGKNYQEVHDWLQRMTLTGINSKGVVYMAQRKAWMSDTFHVFDRVLTVGSVLPDGSVADRNLVWLSEWQLENVNSNYLLPIDFETYRTIKNQIAKVLVPLLQVWLYASRAEGRFEKRYVDLCQILDIARHQHLSLIKRQLEPSLTELQQHGYLAKFSIEPTADGREYKVVAMHGHKFYHDQRVRGAVRSCSPEMADASPPLLAALVERGIAESHAQKVLRSLPASHPILDQLEYADYLIAKSGGKIANPAGFYIWVLRENLLPPGNFETSTKRKARTDVEAARQEGESIRQRQEMSYEQYCEMRVRNHLAELPEEERSALLQRYLKEARAHFSKLPTSTLKEIAQRKMERSLQESLDLMSFDEFVSNPQRSLFEVAGA